ncbi:hypothetical protein MWU60_08080 [Yoonia sp. F2084L]|nr:hypothetical protein [Yoonia sp. F2084L]
MRRVGETHAQKYRFNARGFHPPYSALSIAAPDPLDGFTGGKAKNGKDKGDTDRG